MTLGVIKTTTLLFVYFCINVLINFQGYTVLSEPQVPCFFIFGDSLVDSGNNNQLQTEAKVNYLPYGIDFPDGPTGRFTNGRNTADIVAKLLGFVNFIPPFATAQGTKDITKGVNYASGSAGIRNETGSQMGENIGIDKQLVHHNLTVSQIAKLLGSDAAAKDHLGKCLYLSVVGSNDYLNNYFMPEHFDTSAKYTPAEYATALVQQHSQQLTTLYNFGARRIAVIGLGPLGCIPQTLKPTGCAQKINDAVGLFNDKLKALIDELNSKHADAKFLFIGAANPSSSELASHGLQFLFKPCCKVSNSTGQCIKGEKPCYHRALHVFYDNFHPTEIVCMIVGKVVYIALLTLIM